jgi:WD40 repeat protein
MNVLARRVKPFRGGIVFCIVCAAIAGCGGGSDDESRPAPESSVMQQAVARHALPYSRLGITAIVASPDGKSLAVAHSDGRVSLLDAVSRSEVRQLAGAAGRAAAGLVFSADGRYLVTVGRDSSAQVWNVDTGTASMTLRGHEQPLRAVSASGDSSLVATAGEETRVMLWDGATGRLQRALSGPTDFVNAVSVSRDGQWVASGDASARVLVWNANTGKLVNSLRGHTGEVNAVVFSPDARTLASAGEDGKVVVWQLTGGQGSTVLQGSGPSIRSLAFSSDGQVLAAGGVGGKVTLWDMASRKVLSESSASAGAVNALAFGTGDRSELLFADGHSGLLAMSVSRLSAR